MRRFYAFREDGKASECICKHGQNLLDRPGYVVHNPFPLTAMIDCWKSPGPRCQVNDDQQFNQYRSFVLILQGFMINFINDKRWLPELLALTPAPGRGKRQSQGETELVAAAEAVLKAHDVEGLLDLHL